MRLVLAFVALLLSLPLSPQARPKGYELDYYRVRLESVETDGARGGVIGNPENEQGFTTPGYRDSTIRVVFTFEPTHVDFSLTNESDSDFGIIWDEAVFVDGVSNAAEGVFHRGVKLLDRHDAQVPSVVVKGSCVSESLAVKNRVFYSRDLKRWVFENLLRDADKLTHCCRSKPPEGVGTTCSCFPSTGRTGRSGPSSIRAGGFTCRRNSRFHVPTFPWLRPGRGRGFAADGAWKNTPQVVTCGVFGFGSAAGRHSMPSNR